VRLLLDTQALIWGAHSPERFRASTRRLLDAPETELFFSVINLWEIAVKKALKRPDFHFDPRVLRSGALAHGYREVQVTAEHAFAVEHLPALHQDPFDRLLLCQAHVEGLTFLTSDKKLPKYPVAVLRA
jgi:PIN domain nuclease of toxin-antitoxin system